MIRGIPDTSDRINYTLTDGINPGKSYAVSIVAENAIGPSQKVDWPTINTPGERTSFLSHITNCLLS
jgi:hypothetical protein